MPVSDAMEVYREALRTRRAGRDLEVTATDWPGVKPAFYADSRVLSENALRVFEDLEETHRPFGLVDTQGNSVQDLFADSWLYKKYGAWANLNSALRSTGRYVMEKALPGIKSCPYSRVLQARLAPIKPDLTPFDNDKRGLDTLRGVASPGAVLNASLFTSLIRVLPRLSRLHPRIGRDETQFASNSAALLNEPLSHPQQWAMPFVLTLGTLDELLTDRFLDDELAQRYTSVKASPRGGDRLAWAISTKDFCIKEEVEVVSRVHGSEVVSNDGSRREVILYPAGTRLGDIAIDEPVIGCPGNRLAHAMWQRIVRIAVEQCLWENAN